jgi:hypothetical protein
MTVTLQDVSMILALPIKEMLFALALILMDGMKIWWASSGKSRSAREVRRCNVCMDSRKLQGVPA